MRPGVTSLTERDQPSCQPTSKVATVSLDSVATPGPDPCGVLEENPRVGEGQPVPTQDRTAGCGTDSTPELGGRVDTDSVSGGGDRVDTDSTVPVTCDGPVESEPTCKAPPVPTVDTNGIAGQSDASSHDSGNASGQEVPAEPVAGSSRGQRATKPRPTACCVEQEMSTA